MTCFSQPTIILQKEGLIKDYKKDWKFDYDVVQKGNKYYFVTEDKWLIETDGTEKGTRRLKSFYRNNFSLFYIGATKNYLYYITGNSNGESQIHRLNTEKDEEVIVQDGGNYTIDKDTYIELHAFDDRFALYLAHYNFAMRRSWLSVRVVHDEDVVPVAHLVAGGRDKEGPRSSGVALMDKELFMMYGLESDGQVKEEVYSFRFGKVVPGAYTLDRTFNLHDKGFKPTGRIKSMNNETFFFIYPKDQKDSSSFSVRFMRWKGRQVLQKGSSHAKHQLRIGYVANK